MDLSAAHIGFVLVAYALTVLVLLGLTVWIVVDLRAQHAALAQLGDSGARHRQRKAAQAQGVET